MQHPLLNTNQVPGIILGARVTAVSKRDRSLCFHGAYILEDIETKNLKNSSITLCVKSTMCHGKKSSRGELALGRLEFYIG